MFDTRDSPSVVAGSVRERILRFASNARRPLHLGSSLSAVEILVAVLVVLRPQKRRDVFILSKGHGALGLYAALAEAGVFTDHDLETFGLSGTALPVHPQRGGDWWNRFATGSLGHGVGLGLGVVMARTYGAEVGRCLVVVGDGECQEGSVWEAAAAAVELDARGLCVVVDSNEYGQTGRIAGPSAADGLHRQFAALGWRTRVMDGHDAEQLVAELQTFGSGSTPRALIARTVKGRGSSAVIDGLPGSHFAPLSQR
ncbi:1-deoxy-D-xylulose-5-phosphate synthase N-terminal domain-containing protein [Frankia sp. Cr1]|uniref:1-deoxy-D-xylulose-5-phosphate synthase N-terminal domain-containing protein n=1 Tax=Frankia sp. Cr1 TaxID=3073931 RepID=UPI002AD3C9D0|nr:1-deoxy-D-xylulose-5-phosphate synthase N-terminal domain-containing protein [Frankia sp. Cr1]